MSYCCSPPACCLQPVLWHRPHLCCPCQQRHDHHCYCWHQSRCWHQLHQAAPLGSMNELCSAAKHVAAPRHQPRWRLHAQSPTRQQHTRPQHQARRALTAASSSFLYSCCNSTLTAASHSPAPCCTAAMSTWLTAAPRLMRERYEWAIARAGQSLPYCLDHCLDQACI